MMQMCTHLPNEPSLQDSVHDINIWSKGCIIYWGLSFVELPFLCFQDFSP
ncbi:hypothetical protein MPTK1_3g23370 [Marchantia polymorpha subsp. ruderalis]|uniref:Uncharacterized protein n=2 Tax=Marchantia polymorpha TaxID=3197 RepID=A0AAF6B3Y3_MARPO|nr:hypothetical protein MARPO_0024s0113 [Marchantia polymorpha]BBN06717.1 hypothetical protein Mp_3g23370 [Marchantia polymorpha subsp. ruderalis]|eukprot:PTQ43615.1 hypothetical protein MARPO_0024s0113 [Marchantia polymorpha]